MIGHVRGKTRGRSHIESAWIVSKFRTIIIPRFLQGIERRKNTIRAVTNRVVRYQSSTVYGQPNKAMHAPHEYKNSLKSIVPIMHGSLHSLFVILPQIYLIDEKIYLRHQLRCVHHGIGGSSGPSKL